MRWEGNLIYQHVYKAGADLSRFVPVLRDGGSPAHIPEPVAGASYYCIDVPSDYEGLLRRLFNRPAAEMPPVGERPTLPVLVAQWTERPLGRLHNMPDLPPNFVARPDEITPVKGLLMGDAGCGGIMSGAQRAGLLGMGGIGKSVLAAALARNEKVRKRYSDGVFWISFGRTAVVTTLQAKLAKMLGDPAASFENWQDGREKLRELTAGRAVLLVLDDIWQPENAEAFTRLDPQASLLITTRDWSVLEKVGAKVHRVNLLSGAAARTLLRESAGIEPEKPMPPAVDEIIEECGYLPLAISVIGALIKACSFTWQEVLARLKAADIRHLRANLPEYEHESVLAALHVSVEALPDRERYAFSQCAVLPDNVAVPEAALLTLWSGRYSDEEDARAAAQLLVKRSLLSRDEARRYRLHDLYQDYLRAGCRDLASAHVGFLNAYCKRCPGGWASGPSDGYFFRYLPYHLAKAGRRYDLITLLADYDWIAAKLKATDVQSVLSDYDNVLDLPDLRLIQRALRLSTRALVRHAHHLPSQLAGRLGEFGEPRIRALLTKVTSKGDALWLCPRTASLIPPGPLLQTFIGHSGRLTSLAVLADGRVVCGSLDGMLQVWDLANGESWTLTGHSRGISSIAVLADGRVVSGSVDRTLRVWDMASGESRVLTGHNNEVTSLAVLGDGRVVSGSSGGRLRVWDLASSESRLLTGHTKDVTSLAVLTDGRVVSGSLDGTLRVWDMASDESLTLTGHAKMVTSLAVLADGRVVSGSSGGTLRIWDVVSGENRPVPGHSGAVTSLAVLADGRVVSGSLDGTVRVWDVAVSESRTLIGYLGRVISLAALAGERVVSGSDDGAMRVWDVMSSEGRALTGHSKKVTALAVPADGRVVSGSLDGTLRVWDLASGESRTLTDHSSGVTSLAVLADGRVVSGSAGGAMRVWDVVSGESQALTRHCKEVTSLAVLADGRVVSGSSSGMLRVWDLASGESRTLIGHNNRVTALAVLADGRVVSGSSSGTLRVWDVAGDESRAEHNGHTGWGLIGALIGAFAGRSNSVTSFAALADGRVVSGFSNGTLRVWDVASGQSRVLTGHNKEVTSLAVLADGRVVSGSSSGTLRVWDLVSGESWTLTGHSGWVTSLAAVANGLLVSGSRDWSAILWDADRGVSIASFIGDAEVTACATNGRNLIVIGSANGAVHILTLREPSVPPDRAAWPPPTSASAQADTLPSRV